MTSTAPSASPAAEQPPGLTPLVFQDTEFDGQFLRALDTITFGGADIGECYTTARRITPGDTDSWSNEWTRTGERVFGIGEACRAGGHIVSARAAYLRALTYFRTAGVFMYKPPMDPRFVQAFDRQQEAFQRAGALMSPPSQPVKIPYAGTTLPADFLVPAHGDPPYPTLILTNGYDGTREELYLSGGAAALARGYAVLMYDGPGQGEALIQQHLYFRPDWEQVVTPVVDYLLTRPEVDPARIAIMGRSWGGYLAPRAATAEHRLAALVADAAQYDPAGRFGQFLPPQYRGEIDAGDAAAVNQAIEAQVKQMPAAFAFAIGRGMLTHGVATPLDYLKSILSGYTLKGRADQIRCPTLICEAEDDVRGGDAKPLYEAITAPKKYILFTNEEGAGEHDEAGAATLFTQRVFDWLDEVLAQRG